MSGFFGKINRKIREIRRSDQKTKRNWLVGMTTVVMLLVIVLWIGYLNATVPKLSQDQETSNIQEIEEEVEKDSIFSVFSRGFKITVRSVSNTFGDTIDKISKLISNTKERLENVKEYTPETPSD